MIHPEELLAEYVDGSLTHDERAAVDAHLAGCERCRDEVALARRGAAALSALPEVDLPEGFHPRVKPVRSPRERLGRASWVAGAAAASIAAIVAVVLTVHGPGGSPRPNGAEAAPGSARRPVA